MAMLQFDIDPEKYSRAKKDIKDVSKKDIREKTKKEGRKVKLVSNNNGKHSDYQELYDR